ncbi:MAG: PorV/PorQ family protein [Calditrichaceae bacterium]
MKIIYRLLILVSLISLTIANLFAQGEAAVPFLLIDPSAKGNAMAGAMGSVTNDASANFYNPACLVRTKYISAESNHIRWVPQFNFDNLHYDQTSVAFRIPKAGHFGISFCRLDLGENVRTDETGQELGTFDSYEWAFSIGYAYRFSKYAAIGINFKLIQSNLRDFNVSVGSEEGDGKATGYAFDIGLLFENIFTESCYYNRTLDKMYSKWFIHRPPPGLNLGFSISNMGPKISYIDADQADPLPQNLRLAASWNYYDTETLCLITSVDVQKLLIKKHPDGKSDSFIEAWFTSWDEDGVNDMTLSIGQQISIMSMVTLRLGFFYEDPNHGDRKYYTYGFSFGPETLSLNISWFDEVENESYRDHNTWFWGLSLAY